MFAMGKGGKPSCRRRNLSLTLKNGEAGCTNGSGSGSGRPLKEMGQVDHVGWGKHRVWEKQQGVYEARAGGERASGVVSRGT